MEELTTEGDGRENEIDEHNKNANKLQRREKRQLNGMISTRNLWGSRENYLFGKRYADKNSSFSHRILRVIKVSWVGEEEGKSWKVSSLLKANFFSSSLCYRFAIKKHENEKIE